MSTNMQCPRCDGTLIDTIAAAVRAAGRPFLVVVHPQVWERLKVEYIAERDRQNPLLWPLLEILTNICGAEIIIHHAVDGYAVLPLDVVRRPLPYVPYPSTENDCSDITEITE